MTDYLPPSQEALPCNNNFFDAKLTGGGGGGGAGGGISCFIFGEKELDCVTCLIVSVYQ
jgi:hypothetical protein